MRQKPIILMVDDDQEGGLSRKYLLEDRGYFVLLYENGMDAKEAIQDGLSYHVGIFDISLPEVGGDELIQLSKRLHPDVPVICISGYYALRQMAPGADRYLLIPVKTARLDEVIIELLQEKKDY